MLPRNYPDRIQIAFDDHRLVANAGLILPATLALRLGLPQLIRKYLDLGGAPGRANTGDKIMTLVASASPEAPADTGVSLPRQSGLPAPRFGTGPIPRSAVAEPLPQAIPCGCCAAGRRSVAVAPDPGAVHRKASPGPGCGRQGITRAAHSKRRRSVLRLRRFYAFQALAASGLVWPRGRFAVGRGAVAGATPPYQQHFSGAGATPNTFSRMGAVPDGLTGR